MTYTLDVYGGMKFKSWNAECFNIKAGILIHCEMKGGREEKLKLTVIGVLERGDADPANCFSAHDKIGDFYN